MKNTKTTYSHGLIRDQRGLSTVEYAIILALVAIGGIVAWRNFGVKLADRVSAGTSTVGNLKMEESGGTAGGGTGTGGGN